MGFHVSWITVRGKPPAKIRSELGLTETTVREFVPESEVTAVLLPSHWYMVFFNDLTAPELEDQRLANLSQNGDVMAFIVEEASMVSVARGFAGGRRIWEVVHDSSKGLENLDTNGDLPSAFPAVRDRLVKELASAGKDAADYLFDVPAELSKLITGYRHDEDIEGIEGDAFTVLLRM